MSAQCLIEVLASPDVNCSNLVSFMLLSTGLLSTTSSKIAMNSLYANGSPVNVSMVSLGNDSKSNIWPLYTGSVDTSDVGERNLCASDTATISVLSAALKYPTLLSMSSSSANVWWYESCACSNIVKVPSVCQVVIWHHRDLVRQCIASAPLCPWKHLWLVQETDSYHIPHQWLTLLFKIHAERQYRHALCRLVF